MKLPEKKLRPIYVKWHDSASYDNQRWRGKDEMNVYPSIIETVGQFLAETKREITLVLSHSRTSGNVSGDVTIPKSAILKKKWIEI